MNTMTAEEITRSALAYNADYPEAAAEILAGHPEYRVTVTSASATGWVQTAVVAPVVVLADGGVAYAAEPTMKTLHIRDGRLSPVETAKRASRYLGIDAATVPVNFIRR